MTFSINKSLSWKNLLLVSWLFFIFTAYIFFHGHLEVVILSLVVTIFFLFGGRIVKFLRLNLRWEGEIPLWKAAVFLFFALFAFTLLIYIVYAQRDKTLELGRSAVFFVNIFKEIFLRVIFIFSYTLLSTALGKKIFHYFHLFHESSEEELIFSFGVGAMGIFLFSFILGLSGNLYFSYIVVSLCAAALWVRKEIMNLWKKFLHQKVVLKFSENFFGQKNIIAVAVSLLFLLFIITFIQTLYLVPTEYDDLDTYYSVPLLFSHYHAIVPLYNSVSTMVGGIVMPFFASVNVLLYPSYNFSFSWLFLLFSLFAVYSFAKRFFSKKIAFITILFAAFVPLNINFINTQKVDFIFVFFSILSLYSFFLWILDERPSWLMLSAVFLGFSVNVKMNGLFLVATIFLVLCIFLVRRRISFKSCLIYFLFTIISLLPIFLYNTYYYQNPTAPLPSLFSPKISGDVFSENKKVTLYDIFTKTDYLEKHGDEITNLTRQNRVGNSRIVNFFWLLWNTTINQKGFNSLYSEIGPFLLIFSPFFLFYFFIKKRYKEKNLSLLLGISLIYFFIWYIKGYERVWYALPIIYLLFIFCAVYLESIREEKILKFIYFFIIIFSLRTLFYSFFFMDSGEHIINTVRANPIERKEYPQSQALFSLYDYINKNIIGAYKDPLILMMPESRVGTINEWDKYVIADHWGIYWLYMAEHAYTAEKAKEILLKQKITHIIVSDTLLNWMNSFNADNKQYPTLGAFKQFKKFQESYLEELYCNRGWFCAYKFK